MFNNPPKGYLGRKSTQCLPKILLPHNILETNLKIKNYDNSEKEIRKGKKNNSHIYK